MSEQKNNDEVLQSIADTAETMSGDIGGIYDGVDELQAADWTVAEQLRRLNLRMDRLLIVLACIANKQTINPYDLDLDQAYEEDLKAEQRLASMGKVSDREAEDED